MSATIKRKNHGKEQRLRAELRRHRRFVENLCSQMRAELEHLKRAGGGLADACTLLQANLGTVADVERLKSGVSELTTDVFDLHTVARTAVARHAFTADEHRVRLRCFVHREAPRRVVGDAARLRRLLADLVANALPCSAGEGVFVFVEKEPLDLEGTSVRFTICDREDGPPKIERSLASSFSGNSPWLTPWYASARELVQMMGGDLGVQAGPDGVAIWLIVKLATTMPRRQRSELQTKAPVLLVTKDHRRAATIGTALQRVGLVLEIEPHEQLVPIRLEQANFSMVLMDKDEGVDVATFAARSPDSDEVREVPIVGVPLRDDARGEVDEAALVHCVQQRLNPRLPGSR